MNNTIMITPAQIQKAAEEHAESYQIYGHRMYVRSRNAFISGADWVLQQQRWIPVEEELPAEDDDAVAILFKNPFFGVMTVERDSAEYNHEDKKWYSPLTGGRLIQIEVHNVTHWQPLPPLPTEAP